MSKRLDKAIARVRKRIIERLAPPEGPGYDDIRRLYAAIGPDLARQLTYFYAAVGPGLFRNSMFSYVDVTPAAGHGQEWHLLRITDCDPSLFLGTTKKLPDLAVEELASAKEFANELDDLRFRIKGIIVVWVLEMPVEDGHVQSPFILHAWHDSGPEVSGLIVKDSIVPLELTPEHREHLLSGGVENYKQDVQIFSKYLSKLAEALTPPVLGAVNEKLTAAGAPPISDAEWKTILGPAITCEEFALGMHTFLRDHNRIFLENSYTLLSANLGVMETAQEDREAEVAHLAAEHEKKMARFKADLGQLRGKIDQAGARYRELQLQNQQLRKQVKAATTNSSASAVDMAPDRSIGQTLDRFFQD